MQTRHCKIDDLLEMQHCNLRCLPENYHIRYYAYHYLLHPQLLQVSTDYNDKMAGYVLAKIDDETEKDKKHGHVTSLATLRSHRKLGIATNVMNASMKKMIDNFDANFCSLHVRKTNAAALHLYQDTLNFRCCEVDYGYYLDGEDAYHMKRYFKHTGSKPPPQYYIEKGKLMKESQEVGQFFSKMMYMEQRRMMNDGQSTGGKGLSYEDNYGDGSVPESVANAEAKAAAARAAGSSGGDGAKQPQPQQQQKQQGGKGKGGKGSKQAAQEARVAAHVDPTLLEDEDEGKGGKKGKGGGGKKGGGKKK